jgi:ABC-type dipeptide/oligopeptide/nickel transport system ATPase component
MQNCRVAEKGPKAEMFRPPHEPCAALLLSSVPEMDPEGLTRLLGKRGGVGAVVRVARDLAASWIVSSGL